MGGRRAEVANPDVDVELASLAEAFHDPTECGEPSLRLRKKARQRHELLRAAEALFREKGYEAARIEDIAARCEVATKTVYNYFPSKQSFLIALLDEDRQRFDAAYQAVVDDPPDDPAEALALLIRADIGDVRTPEDKTFWRELLAASTRGHDSPEDEFEANRRMFTRHIERLLAHFQAQSKISCDIDMRVAVDIVYAINAYDFRHYCTSRKATPQSIHQLARSQMRLLVAGWLTGKRAETPAAPVSKRTRRSSMPTSRRILAMIAGGLIAAPLAWAPADAGAQTNERTIVAQAAPAAPADWKQLPIFKGVSGRIIHWNQSGGAWEDSWREAHIKGFQDLTGTRVDLAFYCCALDKLQVQVQSKNVEWSVAAAGTEGQLLQGIAAGLFQKLDPAVVPMNRLAPANINEYAISNGPFASVLTWNTKVFGPGKEPEDTTDIFNTKDFPGKRCFMQSVQLGGTLEVALLADGVPADKLYPLDVERALKKLGTIRNDIVWWKSGAESIQFILDGQCDMGMAFNGRPYERVVKENAPLAITWKNAVLNQSWLAIPKDAPNAKLAQAYLAFLLYNTDGIVQHGRNIGYPVSVPGVFEQFSPEIRKWLAIGPNAEQGVWENAAYYKDNVSAVSKRFSEWLVSGR